MSYLSTLAFPPRVALAAARKSDWSTTVNRTFGGWSQRNQNRSRALHTFDIGFAIRKASDFEAVLEHFHQCRGQVHTFPFTDKLDFAAAAGDGVTTEVSANVYQLYKRYGTANAYDRKITRPKSGTLTITRTRSGSPSTITPTIDYTTGRITVTGHVSGDVYTWAGQFYVPCRYSDDSLPDAVIDRRPGGGEYLVECDSVMIEEDLE